MSLDAISAKRLRRQWEPEDKTWNDDALDGPWEDLQPPLHKASVFALKNVFFFSHATPVQTSTIKAVRFSGASAIVEAPTGSGKTLAFLVPMMERTIRACEEYVSIHKKPPLTRNILGVILSPSRTLAEQTFVVAKNLAERFPFGIQFALCDGVVEMPKAVVKRLRQNTRGAGTFLVTTPKDLADVLAVLESTGPDDADGSSGVADQDEELATLLAAQDDRTRERYLAKRRRMEQEEEQEAEAGAGLAAAAGNSKGKKSGAAGKRITAEPLVLADSLAPQLQRSDDQTVRFFATETNRFIVIVDEADLVFNSPEMRQIVTTFIQRYCRRDDDTNDQESKGKLSPGKKKGKASKKCRAIEEAAGDDLEACTRLPTDFAFVGATVATSEQLHNYAVDLCGASGSKMHLVASRTSDDFISQMQNRFIVCNSYDFLPFLIQMMNLHASKKHFVFFNSYRALQFVQRLLDVLSQGTRPLLFVKHVYTMYEGMTETARIGQYNSFLTHVSGGGANVAMDRARKVKNSMTEIQKRNQIFRGGWKRDGRSPMGSGAILLCTDIAAFGLDVRDVDYVYHFEPPATLQSYVHRVGRVGRMGMKGSSILLLPCIEESQQAMEKFRERKTTSTRFNTVANTRNMTGKLQSTTRLSVENLTEERQAYVTELGTHSALEEYNLPPFAPITSTLRGVILQDEKLMKLAKAAAIAMCLPQTEEKVCWFTPKLALRALLLD